MAFQNYRTVSLKLALQIVNYNVASPTNTYTYCISE